MQEKLEKGIGRDNCNLLSKEYIAVNFSSTKGSQHLFSFIHKCVAHSFPYVYLSTYVHMLRSSPKCCTKYEICLPFLTCVHKLEESDLLDDSF